MHSALWWRDFEIRDGIVTVKKTGIRLPIKLRLIADVLCWLPFYLVVESWRLRVSRSGPKIWFEPDRPRPWYFIWSVLHAAGARVAETPDAADAIFVFDDSTTCGTVPRSAGGLTINRECQSIAKSHVAAVFEQCFGYSLSIDPRTWTGPMVEKSEMNGAHDGRIVQGPCPSRPGHVYQRVIDNTVAGDRVEDLRCTIVDGQIPLVLRKRRRVENRFSNSNDDIGWTEADAVFTPDEQALLGRFARAMKLDWGGIDVLRDNRDGRIYVVDVNKTDLGPPVAMRLRDKVTVTKRLARAFLQYLQRAKADRPQP